MLRIILALLVVVCSGVASAGWKSEYADKSPEVQKWFQDQKNANGISCCNQADGHYFDGTYEFSNDGSVIAYENGTKYIIEKDKILHGHNPTNSAIWFYIGDGPGRKSYCFSAGSMG